MVFAFLCYGFNCFKELWVHRDINLWVPLRTCELELVVIAELNCPPMAFILFQLNHRVQGHNSIRL